MKVCTDCKNTGQCGMELDAQLEGMQVTFCARKEKINIEEVDLKKCPLCGKEVTVTGGEINWKPTYYDPDSGDTGLPYTIYCECGLKFSLGREHSLDELFERWNTRKPMDNIVKQLENHIRYCELCHEEFNNSRMSLTYEVQLNSYKNAIEIVKEEGGV